jgi:hypothetical protein
MYQKRLFFLQTLNPPVVSLTPSYNTVIDRVQEKKSSFWIYLVMDKKQAKQLLQKQINKLDNKLPDSVWKNQAASLVKDVFGENSKEYEWIEKYQPVWYYSADQEVSSKQKDKNRYVDFINTCIETLDVKEVFKNPKQNFLQRADNATLVSIVIFLAGALFVGGIQWGKRISDVQNIELEQENSKLMQENEVLQGKIKVLEKGIKLSQSKGS